MSSLFSCLFLPLLNCLTELPLGSYPECPHSCRLSTNLFREAASCHVGDWGIIFYFFTFYNFYFLYSRTDSKGLLSSSADVGLGPMLPTCKPFQVQLHNPAGLTSVERDHACSWEHGREVKPRWGSKAFDLGVLGKAH